MSEVQPWRTELDDKPVLMFPNESSMEAYRERYPTIQRRMGILAIRMYWTAPEQDNFSAFFREDDQMHETVVYGQEELVTWIGGVALSKERERILHLSEREYGSFVDEYGWRPITIIKHRPTHDEQEMYIAYEMAMIDDELSSWDN